MKARKKMGRPSKYKLPTNETNVDKFLSGIELGLSEESCAELIGVSPSTIGEWKKKHPDFSEDIKRKRGEGKVWVSAQLREAIKNGAKRGNGTAAFFWLKSRTEEFREKHPEIDANTAELKRISALFAGQMVSLAGAGRATPPDPEIPK